MIPEAGRLVVRLERRDGALRATVEPPPRLPLEALLRGRPAEEAARLVPMIFNICAAAQEAAVRSALEMPADGALAARVAAETLREHVIKLAMVWPALLGHPAAREALGHAARAHDDADAAAALRRALFAPLDTAPGTVSELSDWMAAGATAPARAFAAVDGGWDRAWGRADLPLLDPGQPVDWDAATQGGRAVENAPACRLTGSTLLDEVAARRGHGFLWRMAARLVETAAILDGRSPGPATAKGVANAARGAMMVEAAVEDGAVAAFRRLSPTDFALAPQGALETALATLPAEADAPLRAVAQMVIETVDPCVATALEMADA